MAALCGRVLSVTARRNGLYTSIRCANQMMADPMEHATGLEKRELLAKAAGNDNPFDMKIFKRGPGTKDCPTVVPSAFEARIIGCICEEDSSSVAWMWLKQGEPKRCGCGYWFKLEAKSPV
ncbi:cytochrome c oxidase subunit 5B, mitochondrial-like [Ischnura elegans]|uniref:cytochrome c oxidase subunit 5B, mitochondrial-like n=1 Tax=Ischnura elegans TaxID=197161 RepID=UPI001ED885DD|nr:cytochrome c oxidase subunit 5B, mitochondrial-like [Ischnura elegans]